jgi:hypothetical protein
MDTAYHAARIFAMPVAEPKKVATLRRPGVDAVRKRAMGDRITRPALRIAFNESLRK